MNTNENFDEAIKVIFLDIDGVIQPFDYKNRFNHINEIDELNKELFKRFQVDYSKYNKYDIMAVYYDWHPEAIKRLKRILDECNAKIIISSSWRDDKYGLERMKDFFRIYNLDEYIIGMTIQSLYHNDDEQAYQIFETRTSELNEQFKENIAADKDFELVENLFGFPINNYLNSRTREILYYLETHPDIVNFVVIDDIYLYSGIEDNFVKTKNFLTEEQCEECIEILSKPGFTLRNLTLSRE